MDLQENMPEQKETPTTPLRSPQEDKKSRKKPIIISVLVIILIAAVSFAALWYLKNSQTKSTVKDESSKEIKKLTIATPDSAGNLYPTDDFYPFDAVYHVNNQVAEGLVKYEDMTKVVPNLATSWKNPDENTWVFNLKKDVKFHTGRTMTADDVVYSMNKAKEIEEQAGSEIFSSSLDSAKKLSTYQVEIKTNKPDAAFLNKLPLLYIIDSKGDTDTATGGTGPYKIKPGTTPSEDKLDLVAFDDYHGGRPMTRALSFILADSEEDAVKAVKDGKANIGGELTAEGVKGIDRKLTDVRDLSSTAIFSVSFNSTATSSPLQKKEVRQAIRSAIDIDEIIEKVIPGTTPASQLLTQEIPGYNPKIKVTKHDVEKAKQLLTEAGYPDGFKLNFTYIAAHKDTVDLLEKQISKIGITFDRVEIPIAEFDKWQDLLSSGKTDLSIIVYSSDTLDGLETYEGLFSTYSKLDSLKMNQYIQEISDEFDAKKRLKIMQETAAYVDEEALIAPILRRSYYWVTDNSSYVLPRDMPNSGTGTYYWKAHLR